MLADANPFADFLTELAKNASDIIAKAGVNGLTLFALALIIFGVLTWRLSESMPSGARFFMFILVFFGTCAMGVYVFKSLPDPNVKPISGKPFSTQLNVLATSDWTSPTTLPASNDGTNKLRISAAGQWTGDRGGNPVRWCGAGGNGATAEGAYPETGIPEWCLLVKVQGGPVNQITYFKTDSDHIDVTPPCTVSFRINDAKIADNEGSLTVTIASPE